MRARFLGDLLKGRSRLTFLIPDFQIEMYIYAPYWCNKNLVTIELTIFKLWRLEMKILYDITYFSTGNQEKNQIIQMSYLGNGWPDLYNIFTYVHLYPYNLIGQ